MFSTWLLCCSDTVQIKHGERSYSCVWVRPERNRETDKVQKAGEIQWRHKWRKWERLTHRQRHRGSLNAIKSLERQTEWNNVEENVVKTFGTCHFHPSASHSPISIYPSCPLHSVHAQTWQHRSMHSLQIHTAHLNNSLKNTQATQNWNNWRSSQWQIMYKQAYTHIHRHLFY